MANDESIAIQEPSAPESIKSHPAWFRLLDQLSWYDLRSQRCQRWYKWLKFSQLVLAISIPFTSLFPAAQAKWISALAGAVIAVLEGVQQMNQYSTLWVTYRGTAERLKHEKYLFLTGAGPYRDLLEPERLVALAEKVEEHVSSEHANWFNETHRGSTTPKVPRA